MRVTWTAHLETMRDLARWRPVKCVPVVVTKLRLYDSLGRQIVWRGGDRPIMAILMVTS